MAQINGPIGKVGEQRNRADESAKIFESTQSNCPAHLLIPLHRESKLYHAGFRIEPGIRATPNYPLIYLSNQKARLVRAALRPLADRSGGTDQPTRTSLCSVRY